MLSNFLYYYNLIFLNFKIFYLYLYLGIFYNFSLMFMLIIFVSFFIFCRGNKLKFFSNDYIFFFKTGNLKCINSYIYYFYLNLVLALVLIVIYLNYLYYSNLNYFVLFFFQKIQFLNLNFQNVFNLDYLNFYFVVLTNFIFLLLYLVFINFKFKKDFYTFNFNVLLFLLMLIEVFIILTFLTSNFFFFFFFFECSLIPMFLLLQIFGKGMKKKQYASYMLVFFTLLGSIFLLFGIVYLSIITNSFDFKQLSFEIIDFDSQIFLFFLFFLGFSVKVPIFPFYSWLPEAHVEASTTVSILLASIFLKVATYGLLKIVIFNFYLAVVFYNSIILYFSIISIFIASLLSLLQTDLKKVIALSSIIHMNYMVISIFSLDCKSILGSLIYMFSHALVSSALFYIIGYYYENCGTRDLLNFSSTFNYSNKFSFYFIVFNLANMSFPLTVSFLSEIIIFNNLVFYNALILFFLTFSIFFSTIYTFWLIHNLLFSKVNISKNYFVVNKFDMYFLNFLLFFVIALGILPSLILFNIEQEIYLILINKLSLN